MSREFTRVTNHVLQGLGGPYDRIVGDKSLDPDALVVHCMSDIVKAQKSLGVLHRAWGVVPPYYFVNGTHIAPDLGSGAPTWYSLQLRPEYGRLLLPHP